MTTVTPGRTRPWIWFGRAMTVAFLLIIATATMADAPLIGVVAIAVVLGVAFTWLGSPRRRWWGPGPMAVCSDDEARRRWRRGEILFFGLAFVGMLLYVAAVTVFVH